MAQSGVRGELRARLRRARPVTELFMPNRSTKSTNRFLLILSFLCFFAVPAFAQTGTWARQRTGTMSWLHAVFFLDQNRGWAAGSKGMLLQTSDGGNTWTPRGSSNTDVV